MTKEEAKKALLRDLATIISKDDDLFPVELEDGSRDYKAWDTARNELEDEFLRRAGGGR